MKHLSFFTLIMLFSSCTHEVYIQVKEPPFPIPDGTTAFTCTVPIDKIVNTLRENSISYSKNEVGYVTELFHLDDGTVARFNIYENEGVIKVVPFWGITDKVRTQMAVASGVGAAMFSSELKRISYNTSKTRPKMVFDYAVQLFSPIGRLQFLQQ